MDKRTDLEKKLWDFVGPPLYYCEGCMLAVDVKPTEEGKEPIITRPCDCNAQIIAPRKAIAAGEGGLNLPDTIKVKYWQVAASLTGRCV